jgi:Extensin-like protein C-terminus
MRWPEPALRAVLFACIPALAISFSILPANAHAGVSAFSRLAAGASLFGIEVRHRLRRHRRLPDAERAKPEEPQKSDTDAAKPERPVQPPVPFPKGSEPEKPNEASKPPEPMGPPPQTWTATEVESGRKDCDKRLSGLPIIFERLDPIREGACGLPSPVRLNGFESEHAPQLAFNPAPTTSCKMAQALKRWFDEIVQPKAKAYLDATIVRMSTLSGYDCRSRYDDPMQRLSQHAYGNALTWRNSLRRKASASLWPTPGARAMSAPISFAIFMTAPARFLAQRLDRTPTTRIRTIFISI